MTGRRPRPSKAGWHRATRSWIRHRQASQTLDQERLLVALAYGLYLISFAGGLSLLIGFIVALVRKPHARGTIYESHYRNLIQVFFVMLIFVGIVLAAALAGSLDLLFGFLWHPVFAVWQWPLAAMMIPVAATVSLLLGIWFLWRVVRGFVRVLDDKPY